MKADLIDTTFLILIRLDSIQRLENILCVTEQLCRYFNTNVIIREADNYCNTILKSLLIKKVHYEFVEDKDPVLYKTRHFNQMLKLVTTTYVSIWDADIVPDKKNIIECMEKLRNREADVVWPYNGVCYDIPVSIKSFYLKKRNIKVLYRHKRKMNELYPAPLVGGAVIMNTEKYIQAGGENERYYGWGNDDYDRKCRFINLNYVLFRTKNPLFHLSHFRNINSVFRSTLVEQISSKELIRSKWAPK